MADPKIDELNRRFAVAGVAEVVAGHGGMAKIVVSSVAASAEIYLHGAHVTSFKPTSGEEFLFLSEQSYWQSGKAIRGGVPICFPWFRDKKEAPASGVKAPAHGFARITDWQLESIDQAAGGVVATLSLTDTEATRQLWPYSFQAIYRVAVGATLGLELTVRNTGAEPFRFEEALHTYNRVGDVAQVSIDGLNGARYLDNRDGNAEKAQQGSIRLTGATDNAYMDTGCPVVIRDPVLEREIRLDKQGSSTTVVWTPWADGAASMADLGDDEWRSFACVEASNILANAITLGPGQEHSIGAVIR